MEIPLGVDKELTVYAVYADELEYNLDKNFKNRARSDRNLRVATTLGEIGEPATPFLIDALANHQNVVVRRAAGKTFIGSEAKAYLYREIDSDSPTIRAAVVGAITKIAQENPAEEVAFKLLIKSLSDSEAMVRCEAAAALGNLAYRPARVPLLELLPIRFG